MAAERGLGDEDFDPEDGSAKSNDSFPANFKEYMETELNFSRLEISDIPPGYEANDWLKEILVRTKWVFWNRKDDDDFVDSDVFASSKFRLDIRLALHKLVLRPELAACLAQFWAPTKTPEGRTSLTTQFQPFALGDTKEWERQHLCKYRMGMYKDYTFCGETESGKEQFGLPGRVFLSQVPESAMDVEFYSLKEYPQRKLALNCKICASLALPVFEYSSHACVGVLEIVSLQSATEFWHDEVFRGRMNENFQEFGLQCFDGYKQCEIQYGDEYTALTTAFHEVKMVCDMVLRIHKLPLALTWVSCPSCKDLLHSQFQSQVQYNYENAVYIEVTKACHLRKGHYTGTMLPFPNLLYCSDVKRLSITEYPLVPNARSCKFGGRFTTCLRSSDTGNKVYVLEFFLPASITNEENILKRLRLIFDTMERFFKTFKLASGQEWGEELSIEVISFQNDQKCTSIQMIPATRIIRGTKSLREESMLHQGQLPMDASNKDFDLQCADGYRHDQMQIQAKDGGAMLQLGQLDQPPMDAINNGADVVSEVQNHNFPNFQPLQIEKVTTQIDSYDRPSMDPSSNGQNVVTAERNSHVVSSSKDHKRKMRVREYKNTGVPIEVPLDDILKCSSMSRDAAAKQLNVSISTFKRVCRQYGINRWSRRDMEKVRPSPVENRRQTPQIDFDLPPNEGSGSAFNNTTGFQEADMVTFWAKFNDYKIKIHLSLSSKFVELQQEIAKRLSLTTGTYLIKYKDVEDEEDGLTLIACDEDLQGCMHTSRSAGRNSVVVLLELSKTLTNLSSGLSLGQQTLFSPFRGQGLQNAEGEPSIIPIMHSRGGDWLDAHFSYIPTTHEEETINRCMEDGFYQGEFVDGSWISNFTVMDYSKMLGHYLSHCHFFDSSIIAFENWELLDKILLPKTEKIFFPVLKNRHWMLLVIDVKKKCILWLDSLMREHEKENAERLARILNENIVVDKLKEQNGWPIKYPEDTPIQENGYDCGVYMMAFMISLATGDKLPQMSQEQTKRMRRTICLELKKFDIIPKCPLVDYQFLYAQEYNKKGGRE